LIVTPVAGIVHGPAGIVQDVFLERTMGARANRMDMKQTRIRTKVSRVGCVLLSLAILLVPGCVPSLHPLYTEQDLVYDERLLGEWAEEGEAGDRWLFEPLDEHGYRVTFSEDGREGRFNVRLLELSGHRYLDFEPTDDGFENLALGGFYRMHWVPAHTFVRVELVDRMLRMSLMNADWLSKHLEREPDSLAHRRRDSDELVLTASTEQLQRFVKKHAEELFSSEATNLKALNRDR
jgi:hypothetical protein